MEDITGTILNISEICTLNMRLIRKIPRKLKSNRIPNEIAESINIVLFLVDQYIANREIPIIDSKRNTSMFFSYILQFCNMFSAKFISLMTFLH